MKPTEILVQLMQNGTFINIALKVNICLNEGNNKFKQ